MNDANNLEYKLSSAKERVLLQLLIDAKIGEINEESDRMFEPYIVTSEVFQKAIAKARRKLNLPVATTQIPEGEIQEWAVQHLGGDANESIHSPHNIEHLRTFHKVSAEAVKEAGLPEDWLFYVASYIVNATPPTSHTLNTFQPISIVEIEEDGIVLKIKKGIRHEEFVGIWKPLAKNLGNGRRKNKKRPKMQRDLEMYKSKNELKSTTKQLAEKFFNGEKVYDKDAAKKALKRQRGLFKKGTDLTK